MENGPSSASTSTPVSPLAPILPLPVRKRKRAYRGRGSAFFRQSPTAWAVVFDPAKVQVRLESFHGQRYKGLEYHLSGTERRLLSALLHHGQGRGRTLQGPATGRWLAEAVCMDPSSVSKVLRRLGECGIVVSLAGGRSMDLAINGDLGAWDLDKLHQLRRGHSRKVTAGIRGPRTP